MSVYTSFDMIADCKSGKAEGYVFLVRNILPSLRLLMKQYGGDDARFRKMVMALRDLSRYAPCTEREFLAELRPRVLEFAGYELGQAGTLDLEQFSAALADLTALERQVIWFDTMGYDARTIAKILRMTPETAAKSHDKALELLRGALDTWNRAIVRDNARALVDAARSAKPEKPVPFRVYVDLIDGRLTWQARTDVEHSLLASWHEVDVLCRVREVDEALRDARPYTEEEGKMYLDLLGVKPPKSPFWKRLARV